jgi:Fur family ferric uptake transcriptional regulator
MQSKRNTEQKRIIYEALHHASHPTASELYDIIHPDNPRMSRATVFRVLAQFSASGVVRKLEFVDSDTRFDAGIHPHAHFRCVCCGSICDVSDEGLSGILNLTEVDGLKVYSTEIQFNGLCKQCAESSNNSK